eukprot:UN04635
MVHHLILQHNQKLKVVVYQILEYPVQTKCFGPNDEAYILQWQNQFSWDILLLNEPKCANPNDNIPCTIQPIYRVHCKGPGGTIYGHEHCAHLPKPLDYDPVLICPNGNGDKTICGGSDDGGDDQGGGSGDDGDDQGGGDGDDDDQGGGDGDDQGGGDDDDQGGGDGDDQGDGGKDPSQNDDNAAVQQQALLSSIFIVIISIAFIIIG